MKKNHINFAHPNKWSDSLVSPLESPSIATKIATRRRTKKIVKTEIGVVTIVYSGIFNLYSYVVFKIFNFSQK